MFSRVAVVAAAMLAIAACGTETGSDGSVDETATPVGERDGRTRPTDGNDGDANRVACGRATNAYEDCNAGQERTCAAIAEELRECRQQAACDSTTGRCPERTRETDGRPCAGLAERLETCRSGCADERALMERACAGDACEETREAAALCAEDFDDCEAGGRVYAACVERERAACEGDRRTAATDACANVEAACARRASAESSCFATCWPLRADAAEACAGERPDEGERECPCGHHRDCDREHERDCDRHPDRDCDRRHDHDCDRRGGECACECECGHGHHGRGHDGHHGHGHHHHQGEGRGHDCDCHHDRDDGDREGGDREGGDRDDGDREGGDPGRDGRR